jgi:hypothetical protein
MAVLAVWSGWLLFLPLDPDYTSGELLDHLLGWRATGTLYPALGEGPTLRVLNYPPLVLAAARVLTELGLPALLAGRLVNGVGVVVLVAALAFWLRGRGVRGAALLGSLGLLGASFPVVYGAGQLHVGVLAVAGTVLGFALADVGRGRWHLLAAGAALGTACLFKQTQVVPAAAALVWLALYRRPLAGWGWGGFAAVGTVGVAGISAAFGAEAWRHMLTYTVGTFALPNLGWQVLSHVAPWTLLMGVAVWRRRSLAAAGRGDAAWWYWAAAAVWSLSAVRVGSGFQYFLDLHLATVVWVGPWVFGAGRAAARGPVGRVLPWALAAQILGADLGVAAAAGTNILRLERVEDGLEALCTSFQGPDPVLAEEAGLARACGRTPALHPFIMTSLAGQGLWDAGAFEAKLAGGGFGVAVLPFDPRAPVGGAHRERWTDGALAAFARAPSSRRHPSGWWVLSW